MFVCALCTVFIQIQIDCLTHRDEGNMKQIFSTVLRNVLVIAYYMNLDLENKPMLIYARYQDGAGNTNN